MQPQRFDRILCLVTLAGILAACGGGGGSGDAIGIGSAGPVTIASGPAEKAQDAFARFTFASDAAAGFECSIDGAEFESCASPHMAVGLSPGTHTLSVRAVDSVGAVGESTSVTWTVASAFGDASGTERHADLVPTAIMPSAVTEDGWRGIFRINCDLAHTDYDDPIVFPGQDNAAHLHRFYGNTLVDENTTTASLFSTGESSCQGNTLNRSSYWVPALLAPAYDPGNGQRLLNQQGEPAWQVVPAVVGNDDVAHEIFYYSAGVDDLSAIQPIPAGLKMVAGNMMSAPGNPQDSSVVRWHCQSWNSSDGTNPLWSATIPECVAPDRLRMDIFFPSCWNGIDLDSSDHKSHLAYPVNTGGPNGTICPETHPVPIIRVSFHYAYGVKPEVYDPATNSSRGWKLASDMYDVSLSAPGGMSLHADWFNAWQPEVLQAILDNCIREELDCHDGNLANGTRLSGTRPGTQTQPTLIQ